MRGLPNEAVKMPNEPVCSGVHPALVNVGSEPCWSATLAAAACDCRRTAILKGECSGKRAWQALTTSQTAASYVFFSSRDILKFSRASPRRKSEGSWKAKLLSMPAVKCRSVWADELKQL